MSPDLIIGLRLAARARYFAIAAWVLMAVCFVAWISAQFAARQPATVALDVGMSLIRLALPVVGVLMLQEIVSREFDRRFFLTSLTYPRPRHRMLLGRLAALGVLLTGLLVVSAAALAVVVAMLAKGYAQSTPVSIGFPYWITVGFALLDLLVISSVGALLAVVATTPSFVLIGTLGFMLVARSFSTVVALLQRETWLVGNAEIYSGSLGLLGYALPDLAALDVRAIALYGQMDFLPVQWPWHVGAALSYTAALIALAAWALTRKRLG